jgi:hypothetical protein
MSSLCTAHDYVHTRLPDLRSGLHTVEKDSDKRVTIDETDRSIGWDLSVSVSPPTPPSCIYIYTDTRFNFYQRHRLDHGGSS